MELICGCGVGSLAKIPESAVTINQTNILSLVKWKRGIELLLLLYLLSESAQIYCTIYLCYLGCQIQCSKFNKMLNT